MSVCTDMGSTQAKSAKRDPRRSMKIIKIISKRESRPLAG